MKLYMHPLSMTCRPIRLFAAESKIDMDEELIDRLQCGVASYVEFDEVSKRDDG